MSKEIKPIKRSKQLSPLSRDHHEGLLFAWKIKQGLKNGKEIKLIAEYVQWFWKNDLKEHFLEEEQILAPHLPADNELLKQMFDEHQNIEALIHINENITDEDLLVQLANAVNNHIRFEERELFPYAEKEIPVEKLNNIYEQLLKEPAQCKKWKRVLGEEVKQTIMNFYQSLYILSRYNEVIKNLLKVMVESGYHTTREHEWTKINQIHFVALSFYILMDVHSYMSEYDNYFGIKSEPQFQKKIKEVKIIAKPAADKIREWIGIRDFRNEIIAHNWRNGGHFTFEKLGSYNTPRTFQDFMYLQTYLEIIQRVINNEFDLELPKALEYIGSLKTIIPAKKANPDFEGEIRKLILKINEKYQQENKQNRIDPENIFFI